jgi:CO dehydrogenase maturation factor
LLSSVEFGDTIVLADCEAGIGTLTRLGETPVDVVLVVVEPTPKSLEVGARAATLAKERNMGHIIVVASRIRNDEDLEAIRGALPGQEIVVVPDDPAIVAADREGLAPIDTAPGSPAVLALMGVADRVMATVSAA